MLVRAGSLALASLLLVLVFGAPKAQAVGKTFVDFISDKEISFPLQPDGLAVAPARFPFLLANNTDPKTLKAQVIVTSRDGKTLGLPGFTASILDPSGDERLYALQIEATDSNKALPAGRYAITVLFWLNGVPPAGRAAGEALCTECQSEKFILTRDAVDIALDDPKLVVPFPSLTRQATATLRETGGKSGGKLVLQSVTAQLGGMGPIVPIETAFASAEPALAGATLARSGIQTLKLPGAADLPIGTWTATVRIRSDQAATPEVAKTITIVSKVASWVLIAAIAFGIFVGYLVRVRLAFRIRLAEANAEAADLAARMRLLAESIRDGLFREICRTHHDNLEAAIRSENDPDRVKKLTEAAAAAIAAGEANYRARELEERQKLNARLRAIGDLSKQVPALSASFTAIADALTRRLALVDQTLVSSSAAEETAYENAITEKGKDIVTWASETARGLADLRVAWPQPPFIGETLKSAADLAGELSREAPADPVGWLDAVVRASRLADRLTATLKNNWLPAVQDEIRNVVELPIDDAMREVLRAAGGRLADAVRAARESAAVGTELRQATLDAWTAARDAEATEQVGAPPVAARTDAGNRAPVLQEPPLPFPWQIAGPDLVAVGEVGRWQLVPTRAGAGDPIVTWRLDDRIVAHGVLTLLRTFEKPGTASIVVEVVNSGEAPVRLSVDVSVRPPAVSMSAAVWRGRIENLQRAQTAILGVLITFSGYFALESDFANWKDTFAGFMWGFSADVTLQTLMAVRTGARPNPTTPPSTVRP